MRDLDAAALSDRELAEIADDNLDWVRDLIQEIIGVSRVERARPPVENEDSYAKLLGKSPIEMRLWPD